jgi:NAD(P)-dependent dehydrogenase (short-subunit alcohol dehydrogenase family)
MRRLADKRILVTGASSGIGRRIATRFAAEGAAVAVGGRDRERAQATRDEIAESGGSGHLALGDVSTESGAQHVVEQAVADLGGLDALVNNAGIDVSDWAPVDGWDVELFDTVIAANLRGPFLVAKYALPHLLAGGGGSIVNMSSICAINVFPGDCAYGIAKAGLNMLSSHIAVEYGPQGIRSNTLMPGVVDTPLHRAVCEGKNDGGAFEADLLRRHPIGRFGSPDEIAEACIFLCSDEARFLTGADIPIDGAYTAV